MLLHLLPLSGGYPNRTEKMLRNPYQHILANKDFHEFTNLDIELLACVGIVQQMQVVRYKAGWWKIIPRCPCMQKGQEMLKIVQFDCSSQ